MGYFANGSEGDRIDSQCSRCQLAYEPCPIYAAQMEYNYNQAGDVEALLNMLIDKTGKCQMLPLLEKKMAVKLCPSCLEYDNEMTPVIDQLDKRSQEGK